VTVRFAIGKDGSTTAATDAGSTLPDATVVACVVRGFAGLNYPAPDGGTAVVTYPLVFEPGDTPPPAAQPAATKQP
jgi:hypothetical protein